MDTYVIIRLLALKTKTQGGGEKHRSRSSKSAEPYASKMHARETILTLFNAQPYRSSQKGEKLR